MANGTGFEQLSQQQATLGSSIQDKVKGLNVDNSTITPYEAAVEPTIETTEAEEKEKAISGYGYYDWGKSAFETSVTVAILPVWYTYLFLEANGLTTSIGSTTMTADAVWALVVAISTLFVAFISPPFGVIADRRLIKKKWLKILTYVGAGATFLLAFAPLLGNASWIWLMVMFLLANVGLNGAGVFYNALLPHLGKEDEMDDISNRAFAYGYLGGGLLLVVHIGLVLGVEADWVIPFCMATAGLWWYGIANNHMS